MTPNFTKKTPKYLYYLVVKFSQWGILRNIVIDDGQQYVIPFTIEFTQLAMGIWTNIEYNSSINGILNGYITNRTKTSATLVTDVVNNKKTADVTWFGVGF